MLGGILIGVAATLAVLTLGRGRGEGLPVAGVRPSCGVSIVFFEPEPGASSFIDEVTGGHGFSHVVVDGCELDAEGQPLIIDCQPGLGVARVRESNYAGRGRVRVLMPLYEGRELYGCVRGRVGEGYDLLGLLAPKKGLEGDLICSQLVYECLPQRLRALVPPWPSGRPVAPNDLARAFGARPGEAAIVLQEEGIP